MSVIKIVELSKTVPIERVRIQFALFPHHLTGFVEYLSRMSLIDIQNEANIKSLWSNKSPVTADFFIKCIRICRTNAIEILDEEIVDEDYIIVSLFSSPHSVYSMKILGNYCKSIEDADCSNRNEKLLNNKFVNLHNFFWTT